MFSMPLFKQNLRSNYKVLLVFLAILLMYFSIIISMYDPASQESMEALLQSLPPELVRAMSFNLFDVSYTGFIASYLYGFLMLLFPLVFLTLTANRMVAKHVDTGSMAYLLSTPASRRKVAFTQMLYLLFSLFILIGITALLSAGLSEMLLPGLLDYRFYILLNLGVFLLHFALASISFLASCLFNDTKNALAFGAGIPVVFFFLQMLGNVGDSLSFLRYATLFTLYQPQNILSGNGVWAEFFALTLIGSSLYVLAILLFQRRDLPL